MSVDQKMAWRNIWRNPRRTILTILAITFACLLLVFMLSFQFGSYDVMINSSVKIRTGHLQILDKTYHNKKTMRHVVRQPGKIAEMLDKNPNIEAYTFRGNTFSLISSNTRTYGAMVVGIDPVKEATVSTLKQLVYKGAYLSAQDTNQALVGSLLAKNLKITIGSELTVLGQGRDGSIAATVLIVKGIYRSGIDEFDRSSIQIPLKEFQAVYGMEKTVHEIILNTDQLNKVAGIKADILDHFNLSNKLSNQTNQPIQSGLEKSKSTNLVVLDWMELVPGLLQSIQIDLSMGIIMYLMLILVVAFSILNTFLMAIFERTREFGVLMAIGTSPGRLTKMLLIESSFITLIGVFCGIVLGIFVTFYFETYGIDISGSSEILRQYGVPSIIYPKLSVLTIFTGPLAVFVITILSALYPILKIRKLRPVEALTRN